MPQRFTTRIMHLLTRRDYQPLKRRALARTLNVPDDQYKAFCQALELLYRQNRIVFGPAGTISLPHAANRLTGTFQATSGGFGFVKPDIPIAQGDIYIPAGESLDAVTGDSVIVHVFTRGKRDGQTSYGGRIIEILARGETRIVGTLTRQGKQWFVQPDGKKITELVAVDDPGAKNARSGDKVHVEILDYPTQGYYANGVIIERLGKSGTSATELKAVIRRYRLADKFSRTALNDTRQAVSNFDPAAAIAQDRREDIRNQTIVTIDPVDARDFDDAISLRKLPQDNWLLGIHIADVAYFVDEGTHLDQEARLRGNSVYLPQHVVPMLPEQLSNSLCSLQQDQDRFVKSAYIKLDNKGHVLSTRFANSVIRSTQRLTYEDADLILDGKTSGFDSRIVRFVKKMAQLARILQKRRRRDGMLTLELPKAELVYDDKGYAIDARPESTSFSHTIIEMFMLEANEAVARLFDSFNMPFLRRVHPEPDSLAGGDTARVIKLCGYVIPKNINRKGLQDLLASVRGKPESFIINLAVLKSLQRAEYSPTPLGHYALASDHYCHFTSPIRRYPDLAIHRLLGAYLDGRLRRSTINEFPDYDQLMELGKHCSQTEKNAEDAENDLRTVKMLQMLAKRLGEEFDAVVTTVTNFGVFVQIERFLFEGLVSAQDINRHVATQSGKGRRGRKRYLHRTRPGKFTDTCPYQIGQELRVRIAAVNIPGRLLDLVPVN